MDEDKLDKMYDIVLRLDERMKDVPETIKDLQKRVTKVEQTQAKHTVYAGLGGGVLSALVSKFLGLGLAFVLILGSGCGTLSASASEMARVAAMAKCNELVADKLKPVFENPSPVAEEVCGELVDKLPK